jgi:hypothetical protein
LPLTNALSLTVSESWALSTPNTAPFQATRQGTDSINFNWAGVNTSTVNQLWGNVYTIAGSGSTTIALNSLTNFVGESVNFAHVYSVFVVGDPSNVVVIGPGSSDGFPVCGSTNTCTIPAGGVFLLACGAAGTPTAVGGSTYNLKLSNPGSTSVTCEIVIVGATT